MQDATFILIKVWRVGREPGTAAETSSAHSVKTPRAPSAPQGGRAEPLRPHPGQAAVAGCLGQDEIGWHPHPCPHKRTKAPGGQCQPWGHRVSDSRACTLGSALPAPRLSVGHREESAGCRGGHERAWGHCVE